MIRHHKQFFRQWNWLYSYLTGTFYSTSYFLMNINNEALIQQSIQRYSYFDHLVFCSILNALYIIF